MSEVSLDWSAAEVKSAKLTVPLEGEVTEGWRKSFAATVRLLGAGGWGEIEVEEDSVRVSDVEPGSEEKLRHHLDAVITQANADQERDEGEADSAGADEPQSEAGDEDEGPDAEMTRRFRSF